MQKMKDINGINLEKGQEVVYAIGCRNVALEKGEVFRVTDNGVIVIPYKSTFKTPKLETHQDVNKMLDIIHRCKRCSNKSNGRVEVCIIKQPWEYA